MAAFQPPASARIFNPTAQAFSIDRWGVVSRTTRPQTSLVRRRATPWEASYGTG